MKIFMATMGLDIGGAETHIVELAKELQAQGHQVTIASAGGVYVPEITAVGITHHQVPMHTRKLKDLSTSKKRLKQLIQQEQPDIVHAHARIPGFLCGQLHKSMKFPFVTTAHWVFQTTGALRFLTNWGQRVIAVSDDIKTYLIEEYNYPSQHISVTINGIDTEKFSPKQTGQSIREEFSLPHGTTLVSVSRMDEDRGLVAKQLIELAPELCQSIPDLTILLVGGGNIFPQLEAEAQKVNQTLGRRAVILTGARTDINQFVAVADLFVGVSRSALEAMAAEKLVIVAGNEGYHGLFTPDKLEEAISGNFCCRGLPLSSLKALKQDILSTFHLSSQQQETLKKYAREVISNYYSVRRMAGDCLAMYENILAPSYHVVVSGYYGFDNAGDDAILQAIHQQALTHQQAPEQIKVTVLSNNPKETTKQYGMDAIHRFHIPNVKKSLKSCDALLSGGGSLLQDRTSTRSILYYLWVITTAQKYNKPVMLYANGIGPVTKPINRKRVKTVVDKATTISLRDPDSKTELQSMGVTRADLHITADPVQALTPAPDADCEKILQSLQLSGDFVTISVREWGEMSQFTQELALFCDKLKKQYKLSVLFVCMQPTRDYNISKKVADTMTEHAYILSQKLPPDVLMSVLGKAKICVAMRLHTLIFSARMGVPLLGLVYDPKVASYLKELGQPSGGDVTSFRGESALKHIENILSNYETIQKSLKTQANRLEQQALQNQTLLVEMLNKPSQHPHIV